MAQYLEIIELQAFQINHDLVFVLKIPLIEQQPFTVFLLIFQSTIMEQGFIISFIQKNLTSTDDCLMSYSAKRCQRLAQQKLWFERYVYPIDFSTVCETQLVNNFTITKV